MNKDNQLIFESYLDNLSKTKNQIGSNIMRMVKYGLPDESKIPELKQQLITIFTAVKKAGGRVNPQQSEEAKQLVNQLRNSGLPEDELRNLYRQAPAEEAEDTSFSAKLKDRENEQDEKQRDAEVSSAGGRHVSAAFHYDPMSGLAKAANQIKDILHGAANDEARTEHIIKMAQIILGNPKEHTPAEYRKMLDGLIVLLNRFIVVPMNEYEEMPTKQFMNLKQFINKGPIKLKKPSKELPSTHSKIHDLAKQDSREGQKEENAENSNTNMIVSHFRKTFGPGEKERMIKNNIDPYEFFVDYHSWMKHYDPKILSNFAEIYNSQYPEHKVDIKKLLSMFQAIKDVPLKGYQAPGKKSENEERRLDPKCWKGYHKQGTKLKDGKRVNNCVKNS